MPYTPSTSRAGSWRQRTRHMRQRDLLFRVVALAATGLLGYTLLGLLGSAGP
jgi:hypothetical protein